MGTEQLRRTMKAASIDEVQKAINDTCRGTDYSCKTVSWDDAQRGTVGGSLSCWGSNITDTRLWEKTGKRLFTVRSDNWNEKLGKISSSEVALLAPENAEHGSALRPITLRKFLKTIGKEQHGGYAGLPLTHDLDSVALDDEVSIRFQTTFLPIEEDPAARGTLEFATEAYNYNTHDDADPRNLVLLCTTQGTAVQQDGKGAKKLFHHAVDPNDGKIHRYWLEAEQSDHKVGGAQKETAEEKADALARGKATSSVIGVKALGTRFNVLMTIQVPLEQKPKPRYRGMGMGCVPAPPPAAGGSGCSLLGMGAPPMAMQFKSMTADFGSSAPEMEFCLDGCEDYDSCASEMEPMEECLEYNEMSCAEVYRSAPLPRRRRRSMSPEKKAKKTGRANAARVSRGSEVDIWKGLAVKNPKRNPNEHMTVTCVIYNTVAGGVPSEQDIHAAIRDMEELYANCQWNGKLAEPGADFMKQELTVADAGKISAKLETQPYTPASSTVAAFDTFPGDDEGDDETPPPASAPLVVHPNVVCDVTEVVIVGRRFKKKGCDYDLCESEWKKLAERDRKQYDVIETPGAMPVDAAEWAMGAALPLPIESPAAAE